MGGRGIGLKAVDRLRKTGLCEMAAADTLLQGPVETASL